MCSTNLLITAGLCDVGHNTCTHVVVNHHVVYDNHSLHKLEYIYHPIMGANLVLFESSISFPAIKQFVLLQAENWLQKILIQRIFRRF